MRSILVATGRPADGGLIESAFSGNRMVRVVSDSRSVMAELKTNRIEMLFVDMEILVSGGRENDGPAALLSPYKALVPSLEVVVLTSPEWTQRAVSLVKAGASGYLSSPFSVDEVRLFVEGIEKKLIRQSELDYLRDRFWREDALEVVQTQNPLMQAVFKKIRSVAPTRTTVLLTGETGTGKGVMARLIHRHSGRKTAQFISVHCGAIADTLLESELFGHEKGAFTGAVKRKMGKFEIARGGTIFLDEIGTITPSAQIKLLQVLQDGTFSRVGGEESIRTDARVIAATNADLGQMCDAGHFRKDLYYRLNVFPIELPPVRDRIEDLPYLVDVLLNRLNLDMGKGIGTVHPQVMDSLSAYDWPGNIRELENLLERAYILETADMLTPESFPIELIRENKAAAVVAVNSTLPLAAARQNAIEAFERRYLKDLMLRNGGRINRSAEEAGISTRQLHKLLSRYGIRKESFKS